MDSSNHERVVAIGGEEFLLAGEAAKRLGLSHNSVLRRLKIGALKGSPTR